MISIALKHYMYELAIDTFFDRLSANFPKQRILPVIGESYSKIIDTDLNEAFYDCVIIPISELTYYDELIDLSNDDGADLGDLAFGIRYKGYEDLDDPMESDRYEEYEEAHFEKDELDYLVFYK